MKKRSSTLLIAMAATLLSTAALADKADCGSDPIHCAYVTGLSSSLKDGRYIKVSLLGKTFVSCMNNTVTMTILPDEAPSILNKPISTQFSICKSKSGADCQSLGADNFVVTKANGQYVGTPQYYVIGLSSVKNQFPQCDGTQPDS